MPRVSRREGAGGSTRRAGRGIRVGGPRWRRRSPTPRCRRSPGSDPRSPRARPASWRSQGALPRARRSRASRDKLQAREVVERRERGVRDAHQRVVAVGDRSHHGAVGVVQHLVDGVVLLLPRAALLVAEPEGGDDERHVVLDVGVDPEQHVLGAVRVAGRGGLEGNAPGGSDLGAARIAAEGLEVDVGEQGVLRVQVLRVGEELRVVADHLAQRPRQHEVGRGEDGAVVAAELRAQALHP